jgi:predicted RNase H-like HicB family nuclease
MSTKSAKSSKTQSRDGTFDTAVLRRARKIAERYRIVLEANEELGYIGSSIELPNVFADGKSPDECVSAAREALTVAVVTMIERGLEPPIPASTGLRKAQVNVRLNAEEKYRLQEAARRLGFKGLGDFIRATALGRCNCL